MSGLGGKLEPASRGQVRLLELAEHGGKGARAQALLDRPQEIRRTAAADEDEPARIEAERGETRSVKPVAGTAPEHRPPSFGGREAGEKIGGKAGRSTVGRSPSGDFVKTGRGQPAPGKGSVEGGEAKGRGGRSLPAAARPLPAALERLDAGPEGLDGDEIMAIAHGNLPGFCRSFSICSFFFRSREGERPSQGGNGYCAGAAGWPALRLAILPRK